MFRNRRSKITEIPLRTEASGQYLPWILGLLIFLLIIILTGASSLGGAIKHWQNNLTNKITVEVPSVTAEGASSCLLQDPDSTSLPNNKTDEIKAVDPSSTQYEKILAILKSIPAVQTAEVVDKEKIFSLLRPWLGQTSLIEELELPILIDVEMKADAQVDINQLTKQLREVCAGVRIESHGQWSQTLLTIGQGIRVISLLIIAFILITVFVIITLITKASMSSHQYIIDTLRLIGAENRYIASQFQSQALKTCFKGALIGALFSIPTLYFIGWLTHLIGIPDIFNGFLPSQAIILIATVPVAIPFFSMMAARVTVMRALAQMDR